MDFTHHPYLALANDINAICQPLEKMGINLFSYRKTFRDGSRINVSNNANWLQDYFNLELYRSSLFECELEHYQSGFLLWPQESHLPIFSHGRDYYNSDNGITLTIKHETYCEFFIFSAHKHDKRIMQFYINHLDLLNQFTHYFVEKFQPLLKSAMQQRIQLDFQHKTTDVVKELYLPFDQDYFKELFSSSSFRIQPHHFSARENSCISGILAGKSAKLIARELNLSYRTIEFYIENIKKKTKCRTRFELLQYFS